MNYKILLTMPQNGLNFDPSEHTSQSSAREKKVSQILSSISDSLEVVALSPCRISSNTYNMETQKFPPPPFFPPHPLPPPDLSEEVILCAGLGMTMEDEVG